MKFNRLVMFALGLGVGLAPASAFAQLTSSTTTTTTGTGGPGSTPPSCMGNLSISMVTNSSERSTSADPLTVSQSDCVKDAVLKFQYAYMGNADNTIAAYTMSRGAVDDLPDCLAFTNRNNSDCVSIGNTKRVGVPGGIFEIPARKFLNALTDKTCHDSADGEQISFTVYIEVIPDQSDSTDYCTYTAALALTGPSPPSNVTGGPGDGAVIVNFSALDDTSVIGYNIYCDDGSGKPEQGGGGSGGTSSTGGGGSGGSGGSGGAPFQGFHPGPQFLNTGGAGGTGGTPDTESTVTSTPAQGCSFSSVLVAGQAPDSHFLVGNSDSTQITAQKADGRSMKNGHEYECGVAAIDTVGNIGVLSSTVCVVPQHTDDFFHEYRGDSGLAGGGLCAIGQSSSAFAAMAAALGASLLGLAARRRSRVRGRRGDS